MYVAAADIKATQPGQLSLSKGQHLQVIDSKRDDWWLVRTKDTGSSHSALEGWVARNLLQHPECKRCCVHGGMCYIATKIMLSLLHNVCFCIGLNYYVVFISIS